jgi:hypothetical protein
MANDERRASKRQRASVATAQQARHEQHEEQLKRSFAKFRSGHRTRTRIPQALREAALAALESGMPELMVRRACGISGTQLRWWRLRQGACTDGIEQPEPKARIFPVVDDTPYLGAESAGASTGQSVQLRVGGWEICIRQVEL